MKYYVACEERKVMHSYHFYISFYILHASYLEEYFVILAIISAFIVELWDFLAISSWFFLQKINIKFFKVA